MKPGDNILLKDLTESYFVGTLVSIDGPFTVTLSHVTWIAHTGRHHIFIRDGQADGMEIEPHFPLEEEETFHWVNIRKWPHPLFSEAV